MALLDGSGADTFTAYQNGSGIFNITTFIDQDDTTGKDTIRVEAGASLHIVGAEGNAPTGDIDIVLTDVTGGVTLERAPGGALIVRVDGVERVRIEDGMDTGIDVDLLLKYDDGTSVTTLKDMSNLTFADLIKPIVIELPDFFSNSITPDGVFQPEFINVGFWDPLVVDLDEDGFVPDLIVAEQYFDLGGDGFAELTAWAGGGDGFLVRDLNDNGRIDNGTELFGTATVDGFTMLATFDVNEDGLINSSDAVWADLQIWNDVNGDAQTQSGELLSLSSLGITAFELDTVTQIPGFQSVTGVGFITHTGTIQTSTGTLDIANLMFARDEQNSRYAEDYTLDLRVLGLPDLIGRSRYADLHIALSIDNDTDDPDSLLSIMQDIASYSFIDAMENYDEVKGKVADLLFRWLGVDDVDPASRGPFLEDGRIVDFIMTMLNGTFFDPTTGTTTVGAVQAQGLEDLWDTLLRQFTAKIVFQTTGGELFGSSLSFDFFDDAIDGTLSLSQDAVDALEAHALTLSNTAAREAFWVNTVDFIYDIETTQVEGELGYFSLSSTDETKLNDAIEASDSNLTWYKEDHSLTAYPVSIEHRQFNPTGSVIEGDANANDYTVDSQYDGTSADDTVYGYAGHDVLNGRAGNDVVYGGDGNDTLFGEGGTDILHGGAGNDTLNAGVGVANAAEFLYGEDGNDLLYAIGGSGAQILADGGAGDDLYYAAQGGWITDVSGDDTIHFYNTGLVSQIVWERYADNTLHMNLGGNNVYVQNFFNDTVVPIETLTVQGDSTVLDLTALTQEITTYGTGAGETIDGIEIGASNVDTIYAGTGNDTISAGSGDDTIYGEDGDDIIDGGDGDDALHGQSGRNVFIASAGTDTIYGGYSNANNVLRFENDTDFVDLEFVRFTTAAYDLTLDHETGTIAINGHFNGGRVDEIQIDDAFATLMTDIVITTKGTASGETIAGVTVGGSLNDVIYGYGGGDTINSGNGNDTVYAGDGDDTVDGGNGNDDIEGGSGSDTVKGSAGADTIYGDDGDDYLYGYDSSGSAETSADAIYGGAGNDTIWGWDGNDVLDGGDGDDALQGRNGNDTYHYSGGLDTMSEVGGTDTLIFASTFHVDDLSFQRVGNASKIIASAGVNEITTDSRFSSFASGEHLRIDTLVFHDGFTLNWLHFWDSNTGLWNEGISAGDAYENILLGTSSNDTIDADAGDDTVHGRAGNDTILGGAGNDRLHGGDGDDVIAGGANNDTIWGGEGIDTISFSGAAAGVTANLVNGTASGEGTDSFTSIENIIGSAYNDNLTGDGYNNTIAGGLGDDALDGGTATDTVSYSSASAGVTVSLSAGTATGQGSDTLAGFENVTGSAYADTLTGDSAANLLSGAGGNDVLSGGGGNDTLDGGDGSDTADYSAAASAVTVNLTSDTATGGAGSDTLVSIESITGSSYADILTGDSAANLINGGDGNDEIHSAGNSDTVLGGGGADVIHLGSGTQSVTGGAGADTYIVQADADTITITDFDVANDILDLRAFTSIGSYAQLTKAASGSDSLITLDGTIEVLLEGVDFTTELSTLNYLFAVVDQTITGTSGNDTLTGGVGNDTISGLGGVDTISGGDGNDILNGGTGNDSLNGGNGTDTADYSDATSAVTVSLTSGTATGGANSDTLTSIEKVVGSAYNDTLTGSANADTLFGMAANDTINGLAGNDTIAGGDGADTIDGGDANDAIDGGAGGDTIRGGSGTDSAVYGVASTGYIVYRTHADYLTVRNTATGDNDLVYNDIESIVFNDVSIDLTTTSFTVGGAGWGSSLPVYGTSSNQTHNGTVAADTIYGLGGSDTLNGYAGNDALYGGDASDAIYGGDGNDLLYGESGQDTLYGGDGDDTLVGGADADTAYGDAGTDTFVTGSNSSGVILYRTHADYLTLRDTNTSINETIYNSVENIEFSDLTLDLTAMTFVLNGEGWGSALPVYGTSSNQTMNGYNASDTIYGLGGNDTINGNAGNDALYGGDAPDALYGGAGNDLLYGENGQDTLYGGDGNDTLVGGADADTAYGDVGTDTFVTGSNSSGFILYRTHADYLTLRDTNTSINETIYNSVENIEFTDLTLDLTAMSFSVNGTGWGSALPVYGTSSNQTLSGYNASDTIYGLGGSDTLNGNYGDDTLYGGDGTDTLYGGADDDLLYGELGSDTLNGQGGADTFAFKSGDVGNGSDTLVDFSLVDDDILDLADILGSVYDPLTEAITDFVQITDNGTHSFLKVDVDGGANSFVQIAQISNVTGLTDEESLETGGYLIAA